MLLVDDSQSQLMELHGVFDERMSAYHNVDGSFEKTFEHLFSAFAFHNACQQFNAHRHVAQEIANGLQMLLSENLRGGHNSGLETIIECNEHRHERHECLTRTHIALQQPIHLPPTTHVGSYFAHHTLLCTRQFKRQMLMEESIEVVANA